MGAWRVLRIWPTRWFWPGWLRVPLHAASLLHRSTHFFCGAVGCSHHSAPTCSNTRSAARYANAQMSRYLLTQSFSLTWQTIWEWRDWATSEMIFMFFLFSIASICTIRKFSKSPLVQNWCSWSLEQEAATRHGWHGRQTSFQPPGLFGPFYWCFPQHQLHQRHKSYRKNWLPQVHLIGVIFLTDYANKTGLLVLCATFGSTSQMLCKMSFPSCSDLFAAFFLRWKDTRQSSSKLEFTS